VSHFTTIRTKLAEAAPLVQALGDLGFTAETGRFIVQDYQGSEAEVEVRARSQERGRIFELGFRRADGVYECVADWHDAGRTVKPDQFLKRLSQRYAYHAARAKLAAQGFEVASEQTLEDGRIHLVLRRVA
jgi:hypothetical protein